MQAGYFVDAELWVTVSPVTSPFLSNSVEFCQGSLFSFWHQQLSPRPCGFLSAVLVMVPYV